MLVQLAWAALGLIIVGGALLAHRSRTAYRVALGALTLLFLPAGAGVHAWNLATDVTYSGFADASWSSFVTDTWESLVAPHDWIFIGVLAVFEATVAVLVLVPGRPRRVVGCPKVALGRSLPGLGVHHRLELLGDPHLHGLGGRLDVPVAEGLVQQRVDGVP